MQYFSTNLDDEFNELEKECLSSGKVLETLEKVIEFVQYEPRPRRHMRDLIARSIITIVRFNNKIQSNLIRVNTSFTFAMDLLGPITPANSFVKKDVRQTLLSDLHRFRDFIKNDLASSSSLIMRVLRPKVVIFDFCGNLRHDVEVHLQQAGANRISVAPSASPQLSLKLDIPPSVTDTDVPPPAPQSLVRQTSTTQTADEHCILVTGAVTEQEFRDAFEALCIADAATDIKALGEKIDYKQVTDSSLQEERFLQMGDWTTDLGDKTQFTNETSAEFIDEYGTVGSGTIGALLMLLPPPAPAASTGTGEEQDAVIRIVEDAYPLFGADSDEEKVKFCEREKNGGIYINLWVVTAAHVVCSNLSMPAGDFDEHITAMKVAEISGDYSEIQDHDRITSIMNLNTRADVCCLYSSTTDVALLRLPIMTNLASTKLHVSANSGHWKVWHAEGFKLKPDDPPITVVKVGAKTGITVGILQSACISTRDAKSDALYKNCIQVKPVGNECGKFCKRGDSGAIYFALLASENPSNTDPNCDVLDWFPIAIHRTSDEYYSYGTPLAGAIKSLIDAKKLPEDISIKMLHQVVEVFRLNGEVLCNKTSINASTVESLGNIPCKAHEWLIYGGSGAVV